MRTGISPIISIIILLGITVAIAGSAYTFIFGYAGGFMSKFIEITPGAAYCRNGIANVFVRNSGSATIEISNTFIQTEEYQPDANTVRLFHFSEGSGTTTEDSAGSGNDGVLGNASSFTHPAWVQGKFGKALDFYDVCQGVRAPVSAEIPENGEPITYEAWIYLKENKQQWGFGAPIIGYSYSDPSGIAINFTTFAMSFWSGTIQGRTHSQNIELNRWHHVAATYDGGIIVRLYIDGVMEEYTIPGGLVQTWNGFYPLMIGNVAYLGSGPFCGSTYYFGGTIDEVRISNIVRDFTQPQQGWSYTCTGSGETYTCGDITVTRTSGSGTFTPVFESGTIQEGKAVRFKDLDCTGKCEYIFLTSANSKKINMNCY